MLRCWSLFARSLACALLVWLSLCGAGVEEVLAAIPPPPGLNYAFVQMQFVEISNINGVDQLFHADFFMLTSWLVNTAGTNFTVSSDLTTDVLASNFWSAATDKNQQQPAMSNLIVDVAFVLSPVLCDARCVVFVWCATGILPSSLLMHVKV